MSDLPRDALVRMRRMATGLLLFMALIFVVSSYFRAHYPWLEFVRAFSEAAMVGGIADWFAVTALFRQPLGLPIPHTAVIPKNKERIAQKFGTFIRDNFFSQDSESQSNMAALAARWLATDENRRYLARRINDSLPTFLRSLPENEVGTLIRDILVKEISNFHSTSFLADMLSILTRNDSHDVLVEELVRLSKEFFVRNRNWIRDKVRESSPWFVPDFVDSQIFEAIAFKTEQTLTDALSDRNHELRLKLLSGLEQFIEELRSSPDYESRGEALKETLLTNGVVHGYIASVREGIVEALVKDLDRSDSRVGLAIERSLQSLAEVLVNDPVLQEQTNDFLKSLVSIFVGQDDDISGMISKTIRKWDSRTLVERLEGEVGQDLQYIRINGTLVGGIVGIVLFGISSLLL